VEVIEVEGSVAVFLSEHFGNCGVLEPSTIDGPLITELDHLLDTFFTFLLERCGGGDLGQGIWQWYSALTGCCLLFLLWQ